MRIIFFMQIFYSNLCEKRQPVHFPENFSKTFIPTLSSGILNENFCSCWFFILLTHNLMWKFCAFSSIHSFVYFNGSFFCLLLMILHLLQYLDIVGGVFIILVIINIVLSITQRKNIVKEILLYFMHNYGDVRWWWRLEGVKTVRDIRLSYCRHNIFSPYSYFHEDEK